jgi:hypothetical protein
VACHTPSADFWHINSEYSTRGAIAVAIICGPYMLTDSLIQRIKNHGAMLAPLASGGRAEGQGNM